MQRAKCKELLQALVECPTKVINLEKAILNWTISNAKSKCIKRSFEEVQFCNLYNKKTRNVVYNLRNTPGFVQKVNDDVLVATNIPNMTSYEMYPELYNPIIDKQQEKERRNLDLENQELENTSGMFTCSKCKSDKTVFYSLQTRSADEPMTNYITCLKCGKKWKN
tara:strand:+ start:206 stop:703 length:498 start_codon:yes stop_codon:yes gene_type:complete